MSIRLHLIVFGILILTLVRSCDFYADYENRYNGNIEGTVTDRHSGEPLEGVTVFYDYYGEDDHSQPGDYYYYYEFEESTETDAEGKFLIRNLEEKLQYVIVLRKWPGYEQEAFFLTPTAKQTDRYQLHLEAATASFLTDPEELHFPPGENERYLVLLNQGQHPFAWTLSSNDAWVKPGSTSGTLEADDADVIFVKLTRTYVDAFPTSGSLLLTILSTGETTAIPVTADQ